LRKWGAVRFQKPRTGEMHETTKGKSEDPARFAKKKGKRGQGKRGICSNFHRGEHKGWKQSSFSQKSRGEEGTIQETV